LQTENEDAEKVLRHLRGIAYAEEDEDVRAGERLRALELLGKLHGMFRESEVQAAAPDEVLSLLLKELRAAKRRKGADNT